MLKSEVFCPLCTLFSKPIVVLTLNSFLKCNKMPTFYVVTFLISLLQDGYQQNFKRGSGQSGPRGAPRGNSQ